MLLLIFFFCTLQGFIELSGLPGSKPQFSERITVHVEIDEYECVSYIVTSCCVI